MVSPGGAVSKRLTESEKGIKMNKDYLQGFSNFGAFAGVDNRSDSYAVSGARLAIAGAVSCSKTDSKSTTAIPADDNPEWDVSVQWTGTDLTTVVRQMSLTTLATFLGISVDSDGTLEEGALDAAREVALNFRAPRKNGGYRGFRYYCCKLTDCDQQLNTRGSGNNEPTLTLKWRCSPRAVDGKIRGTADFSDETAVDQWLLNIPSVGVSPAKPSANYFTKIAQAAKLPSDPEQGTLYILTAKVTDNGTTYAPGDSVYWDGSAWRGYTVAAE